METLLMRSDDIRRKKQFNPICPRGRSYMPPLPRICVYLCKYMYECVEKSFTFLNYKFGKGHYAKLSRFAEEKNNVCRKCRNS